MDFSSKPVLEQSAVFWLDNEQTSGIELYGPDTSEFLQASIIIGRAEASAIELAKKETDPEIKNAIEESARRKAMQKALPVLIKSLHNITLDKKPVEPEQYADFVACLPMVDVVNAANFVFAKDSFLGKPQKS